MSTACALEAVDLVVNELASFSYQWSTERELQEAVSGVLSSRFEVRREVPLCPRDRPDFVVDIATSSIAVEVKVSGSRNAILRQLGRYAEHAAIHAVVLASARRTLLWGLPPQIHGKPLAGALVGGQL